MTLMSREVEEDDYLYRYEAQLYSVGVDEDGYSTCPPRVKVHLHKYRIVRWTPKGAWIDQGWEGTKFVLLSARKQWACTTENEARESFLARKRRQVKILTAQRDSAIEAMAVLLGVHPDEVAKKVSQPRWLDRDFNVKL